MQAAYMQGPPGVPPGGYMNDHTLYIDEAPPVTNDLADVFDW